MKSKVVVITGASRGIGEEIAMAFAREKAMLVLVARTPEDLERVRGRAMEAGSEDVLTVTTDISKEEEVEVLMDVTLARFGRIDILVNNAGVGFFNPVAETALSDWDRMFNVNVRGLFLCTREALKPMLEQGSGHIINISSVAGRRTFTGAAGYCATKFAVDGFTETLRKEVQPQGIKVTSILPGFTDTFFADSEQGAADKAGWLKAGDVAKAVLYAASQSEGVLVDEVKIVPSK